MKVDVVSPAGSFAGSPYVPSRRADLREHASLRSLASEFPNDNPALHHGVIWVCRALTGRPEAERVLDPQLAALIDDRDEDCDELIVVEELEPLEMVSVEGSDVAAMLERPLEAASVTTFVEQEPPATMSAAGEVVATFVEPSLFDVASEQPQVESAAASDVVVAMLVEAHSIALTLPIAVTPAPVPSENEAIEIAAVAPVMVEEVGEKEEEAVPVTLVTPICADEPLHEARDIIAPPAVSEVVLKKTRESEQDESDVRVAELLQSTSDLNGDPLREVVEAPSITPAFEEIVDANHYVPTDSTALPPPSDDPFTILVCTLADVAIGAGSPLVASILPGLLFDGRLPEMPLDPDCAEALRASGVMEGNEIAPAFAVTTSAWCAILRGTSDDFTDCGAAMLDEWASDLLARLLKAPAKALRQELRSRGVAAFGLVDAAA